MLTNYEVKLKLLEARMVYWPLFQSNVTRRIVVERSPDLIRTQLSSGKDYDGNTIQTGYSAWWGDQRLKVGKQVDYVDLNYSGNFYDGIFAEEVEQDEYRFGSDVEYAHELISRYDKILGLSNVSLNVLREFIKKELVPQGITYLQS